MTFGGKLQLSRKQKGMSQELLASQLTKSRQFYRVSFYINFILNK